MEGMLACHNHLQFVYWVNKLLQVSNKSIEELAGIEGWLCHSLF